MTRTDKFNMGSVYLTPGAAKALGMEVEDKVLSGPNPEGWLSATLRAPAPTEMMLLLGRHQAGDWGIMDEEDKKANEDALVSGGRLMSSYITALGVKVWIITEADKSSTTVLLPEEY